MADCEIKISIEFKVEKQPGDCRKCTACNEQIFGSMYIPMIKINKEPFKQINDISLCEACNDLMDEDDS